MVPCVDNNEISITKDVKWHNNENTTIRREYPVGACVYGSVQGVETWITVDTGASKTIVSKGLYDQMDKKPDFKKNRNLPLSQASSSQLLDMGMANLKFSIGDVNFEKEVVVADIQDDVLIGLDIGDPFDAITSEQHVSTHVRIMNLSDKPVTIHEDSVIGYAEEVDPSTTAVVYQETETQDTDLNMSATRQV